MLKNSLYKIVALSTGENTINAEFELNTDNPIFDGHFPGQPVLPGACMLQIVKEILETGLKKPIRLKIADQLKFLKIIDPNVNKTLNLKLTFAIDNISVLVTGNMSAAGELVFKLKGIFIILEEQALVRTAARCYKL